MQFENLDSVNRLSEQLRDIQGMLKHLGKYQSNVRLYIDTKVCATVMAQTILPFLQAQELSLKHQLNVLGVVFEEA
jgi:hypothetical protein